MADHRSVFPSLSSLKRTKCQFANTLKCASNLVPSFVLSRTQPPPLCTRCLSMLVYFWKQHLRALTSSCAEEITRGFRIAQNVIGILYRRCETPLSRFAISNRPWLIDWRLNIGTCCEPASRCLYIYRHKSAREFFSLHSGSGSEFPTCRCNGQGGFHTFLSGESQVKECRLSESRMQPSVSTFLLCPFDFHPRFYLLICTKLFFVCVRAYRHL